MNHLLPLVLFISLCLSPTLASAETDARLARLTELADSLHSAGRTDSAAIVGAEMVSLAQRVGSPAERIGAYSSQGVYLRSLGRLEEALESYNSGLEIATSEEFRENPGADDIEEIASLYINLAVLNLDLQQKDEAARNATVAAEWISRSGDASLRSVIFGVAASVLMSAGDNPGAVRLLGEAYGNAIEAEDDDAAFRACVYAMLLSDRLGDRPEAEAWRRKARELLPGISSTMSRLAYYQAECSICFKGGDNRGALEWMDMILALDGIDNLPFIKLDCYTNMHTAYASLGDYEHAYSTLLVGNGLRDSLMAKDKEESLRELTVKYETKETQLSLARSEARRARMWVWLLAALALLVAALAAFVVYAGVQRRRRMKREMEFAALRADTARRLTQQYVEGLENERRRMAGELHDGVCNDLLAIEMNIGRGEPTEEAARMIASCRESVRRISHELMPPEFAYASLDEVLRFFVAKQAKARAGKIEITYASQAPSPVVWQEVNDATALEVYRIVQEAVGNAVKHSGADRVSVRMSLADGVLEATVADNGRFAHSGRKGMGLDSIRRRAASIGGRATVESRPEGGTEVRLTVKIYGNP